MLRRLAIGAFLVALVPTVAHARDSRTRVVVRFAPNVSKVEAARLLSALRAQLGDAATTTTLEVDATSSDCVVAVDRSERGLIVHMTEDVALEAGTTRIVAHEGEVGATEVASIVRAFVLATTERAAGSTTAARGDDETREIGSAANPESMPTAPLASPSPSEPESVVVGEASALRRARIAALYTGATYAAGLPWQSGARVEGAYAFRKGFYGGLTYAVHPAAEIATESASVLSSRQSGAVFAGIENEHHGWAVGTDASVGLERTARSSRPSTALTGTATRLAPIFAVRLHGRFRLPGGRGAALDFAPTFEVVPGRDRLVLDAAGSTTELVVASARFRVDVGGTFDLF